MPVVRRMLASPAAQAAIASVATGYLRLVWKTSRALYDPDDAYDNGKKDVPAILAVWHGQHFMMPFLKQPGDRVKVLISRHRDGELNARVAEKLGIGTIRGSGAHGGDFHRKGGLSAFHEMLAAIESGYNIAMTADIPKVSRVAGLGIIKLAQHSGRPIYPIGIASQRRYELDNWDRTAINLPFGRIAFTTTGPIRVPADANAAQLEERRQFLEGQINEASARAYALADGPARG